MYSSTIYNNVTSSDGKKFFTINGYFNEICFSDYIDSEIDLDSYYEIGLNTTLDIDITAPLNIRIPYITVGDYLIWVGENCNDVTDYSYSMQKKIILSGSDLIKSLSVRLRGYLFGSESLNCSANYRVDISVNSFKRVSSDSFDSYEEGYEDGYKDGEQFGYSDGYNSGFSDGEDKGFNDGFEAGKDSVDIDSVYMQGYEAGSEVAYIEGYDEGYLNGYAEALTISDSSGQGLIQAQKSTYNFDISHSVSSLSMDDFNTPFPSHSVWYEGTIFEETGGHYDSAGYIEAYGYNMELVKHLFTPSQNVYAYRINIKPSSVALSKHGVSWIRPVIGGYSDVVKCDGEFGETFVNGANRYSYLWYINDYSQDPLYLGLLAYFLDQGDGNTSYSLNFKFELELIPYTKNQYDASVSAIEKQTLEIKKQTLEMEEQTEEMKEQTETQKGMLSKMSEFFGGFFDNLKNVVIGLFVPSKEEMGSLFDRLMQFFNDTFGFLFYPFDFIVRLVELFLTSTNDNTSIVFPGFSIMGMQVWETMEIDLAEYEVTRDLFGYVRMVTGAIIAFGFIDYLRKYFDKRFGGGGS